jgi:hypothetical protein
VVVGGKRISERGCSYGDALRPDGSNVLIKCGYATHVGLNEAGTRRCWSVLDPYEHAGLLAGKPALAEAVRLK